MLLFYINQICLFASRNEQYFCSYLSLGGLALFNPLDYLIIKISCFILRCDILYNLANIKKCREFKGC